MLAAWLLLSAPALGVVEVPDPAASTVAVGIAAPRGDLSFDAAECLAELMVRGTQAYSGRELRALARQAGTPLRVRVAGDFITVALEAPATSGAMALLSDLSFQLTQAASLAEGDVAQRIRARRAQTEDPLRMALGLRSRADWTPRAVQDAYRRVFNVRNLRVVVSGKFANGEAISEFRQRFLQADTRLPSTAPLRPKAEPIPVTLPTLVAVGPRQRDLSPVRVVAAAGLSGKSGTLWRVIRQRERWSYDQRVILWPRREGWEPTLIVLSSEERDREVFSHHVHDDLKLWSDANLRVAQRQATDSLYGRTPFGVLWLDANGPMGPSLADRASLMAISLAMGGQLNPVTLAKMVSDVPLGDVVGEAESWSRAQFPERD
jgi:hypothetical protein